ncbi:MAG TPA: hypothetical protein VLA93_08805 [Pyrinomonadaceae bacterium]|nr:hypothetical protein [Pyrinomonadaceae bacterium]
MILNRNAIILAVFALVCLPLSIYAQSSQPTNEITLRSVIRKGSDTTYFDLLRMLLPDLQMNSTEPNAATAHRTIPFRNIEAKKAESLEGNFTVTTFGARLIRSGGRRILLVQQDLSAEGANEGTPYEGEAALLAAFSVEPQPKLLDVIDLKTDRFTDFWEDQPVFQLNAKNDGFVIHNTHWNAGESYDDYRLLFLDGERFKVITNIFLFNTQGCGATFTETPRFSSMPAAGKYPNIVVKVKVKKDADGEECSRRTRGYTRYYEGVFSWSTTKGNYQSNSPQLMALERFNRSRM